MENLKDIRTGSIVFFYFMCIWYLLLNTEENHLPKR